MYDLKERISYLKGLADGLGVKDDDTKESRVISGMLDLLDDITDSIVELDTSYSELDRYIESIDEDLELLEDIVFDEDTEEYDEYMEFICPNCHQAIYIDDDELDNEDDLICPSCDYIIYSDEYHDDVLTDEIPID